MNDKKQFAVRKRGYGPGCKATKLRAEQPLSQTLDKNMHYIEVEQFSVGGV